MVSEKDSAASSTAFFVVASQLAEYRDALLANGFKRSEAIQLCIQWMQSAQARPPQEPAP